MSTPTTGNPAAGWYTDPGDPAGLRWYDGSRWTAHVQARPPAPVVPAPVAAPPPYEPAPVYEQASRFGTPTPPFEQPSRFGTPTSPFEQPSRFGTQTLGQPFAAQSTPFAPAAPGGGWMQPVESHYLVSPASDLGDGRNTPARVALLVSVLGMLGVPIAALAAIILAVVGLRRARTLEAAGWEPKGRGRARWALGLGIIGLVLGGLLVANYVRSAVETAVQEAAPASSSPRLETEISSGITAQTGATWTVQCPDPLPAIGAAFDCTALDAAGVQHQVHVVGTAAGSWSWQVL